MSISATSASVLSGGASKYGADRSRSATRVGDGRWSARVDVRDGHVGSLRASPQDERSSEDADDRAADERGIEAVDEGALDGVGECGAVGADVTSRVESGCGPLTPYIRNATALPARSGP